MIEIYEIRYSSVEVRFTFVKEYKNQFYTPFLTAKTLEDLFTNNKFKKLDKTPLTKAQHYRIKTQGHWHFLFKISKLDIRILRKDYPEILL